MSANTALVAHISADPALQGLFDAARADQSYCEAVDALRRARPLSSLPPEHPARLLRSCWDDLSVMDDSLLVLNDSRIVVPKQARPKLLELLHASHSGIAKTRKLAQSLYFWPGMGNEIAHLVQNCDLCQTIRPSLHAVPQQHPPADAPMHSVSADLFHVDGKNYLVMVDRYSNYMWVEMLNSTVTSRVTAALERWFLELGYPFIIISDGGPQFRTEFGDYCALHNIVHVPSSPHNPRSNGLAEAAVKSAKYLVKKSVSFADFQRRLMAWRNVPSANSSLSPSEKFYNRRQRTDLPTVPTPSPPVPPQLHGLRLPPLPVGTRVRLQHPEKKTWGTTGVISGVRDSGLSYFITRTDGRTCVRGRRLVREDKSDLPPEDVSDDNDYDFNPADEFPASPPPPQPPSPPAPADADADSPAGPSVPPPPAAPAPTLRRSRRRRRRPQRYS